MSPVRQKDHDFRQICLHKSWRGALLTLLPIFLLATGCSLYPGSGTQPEGGIQLTEPLATLSGFDADADTMGNSQRDSLQTAPAFDDATAESAQSLSPHAMGQPPSLADLNSLFQQALVKAADNRIDLAADDLTAITDQTHTLVDSGDSCARQEVLSLERRSRLLKGILVEEMAFAGDACDADLLLARGYKDLAGEFPDSLVPATGEPMPGIMADLLKWDNPRVDKWMQYFTGSGRSTFTLWLQHKAEAGPLITAILTQEKLPPQLIYLAMIESGISPSAVSVVQAVGPWQFMAPTGKARGLHTNWWVDERRDLELSTFAAADYLKSLHETFHDWSLVLAAYNSGENRVQRKIRQRATDNYWDLNLPAQTADFVPKFIAAARIGEDPGKYGFIVQEHTPLAYDTIKVKHPTGLDLIARCAGSSLAEISKLNPALLRGATPPGLGNYPVHVPSGAAKATTAALARIPADKRLTWTRHKVRRGETLSGIAAGYGCSVSDIVRVNHMKNVQLIRPGDQLLIPMPVELDRLARSRAAEKGHYVPPAGYKQVSYQVKPGDTLGAIARKLGVTLRHLRKVNNIHKSSLIHPGDRLFAYKPRGS